VISGGFKWLQAQILLPKHSTLSGPNSPLTVIERSHSSLYPKANIITRAINV